MKITLLAACAENNAVIGADGDLPWSLPSDLKRFKEYTKNKIVVMGSSTFESLPVFLYDRVSIVLSSSGEKVQAKVDKLKTKFNTPSPIVVMDSIEALIDAMEVIIDFAKNSNPNIDTTELVIIGGESVYTQFLPIADKLVLSLVKGEIFGDKFFPRFDRDVWNKTSIEKDIKEETDEYEYSVLVMECSDSNIYKFPDGERISKLDTYKLINR